MLKIFRLKNFHVTRVNAPECRCSPCNTLQGSRAQPGGSWPTWSPRTTREASPGWRSSSSKTWPSPRGWKLAHPKKEGFNKETFLIIILFLKSVHYYFLTIFFVYRKPLLQFIAKLGGKLSVIKAVEMIFTCNVKNKLFSITEDSEEVSTMFSRLHVVYSILSSCYFW